VLAVAGRRGIPAGALLAVTAAGGERLGEEALAEAGVRLGRTALAALGAATPA
jgi:hypothetical protein